ncbi:biosynthesis glycosyltransferase [compost metagenome]
MEELFQGDINIYPSIPELDPSEGQDIIYTGPIIWDGYNRDLNYEKRKQRQNSDQKIVTVYTGRMSDLGGGNSGIIIFRMLMKVFRNFDCLVRLTTGGLDDIPIRDLQDVPSNVQIYNWIPVLDLYQDTDLIIHHGGHASCLSSLIYGTPTLVMPTHSEREYNARKLSELGVSEFIDPRTCTYPELLAKLQMMLENANYTSAAKKISEALRQREYKKEILAADLIESLF